MNKNNPYGYKVGYRENGNRPFIKHYMTYNYKQALFSLLLYRKYPQRTKDNNRPIVDPFWEIKPITKKEYLAGIWDELPFKRKTPPLSVTPSLIHDLLSIVITLRTAFCLPPSVDLRLRPRHRLPQSESRSLPKT